MDIFRLLVDSGRLVSDQPLRDVMLTALTKPDVDIAQWADIFLARECTHPQDDVLRLGLREIINSFRYVIEDQYRLFRYFAEKGIKMDVVEIYDDSLTWHRKRMENTSGAVKGRRSHC